MDNKKRTEKILKISAVILTLIFLVALTFLLYPIFQNMQTPEGRTLIKQKTKTFGVFAPIVYVVMCVLNIVVPIIPGEPVEILGGLLFGYVFGTIFCVGGILLGSFFAYLLAKKFGQPLVEAFVKPEKLERFKFLKDEKKLELITLTLFLLPGIPKDILCYIIPSFTKMPPVKYFTITTLARFPSVVTSVLVGSSLGDGHFWTAAVIFVVTAVIGYVIIFVRNKNNS
jgi:uncharacterized membrane protein YdjX (TVP38/TMEM64 family)